MTMWLVQNKPCPLMPEKQGAQLLTWDLQQSAKALVSFKEVRTCFFQGSARLPSVSLSL